MKIKAGDQALINGRRVEAVEPYKVKNYWQVVDVVTDQIEVMSTGTLATFRVKPINEDMNDK